MAFWQIRGERKRVEGKEGKEEEREEREETEKGRRKAASGTTDEHGLAGSGRDQEKDATS